MTIESEKLIERKLVNEIKKIGGWCIKLPAIHITGIPDRLCLVPLGRVLFVELKTTGQKPKRIQTFIHHKLRMMGFRVEVIDSTRQIKELIKEYENVK